MLNRLEDILEKEEKILQELVELEEKARQVLIERDVRALETLGGRQEHLAAGMQKLEKQRAALVPPGCTLKEYLRRENPPGAARLEHLRQSLLEHYDALLRRQKITRRLLLFNRQMAEQALRLLLPRGDGNGHLYSSQGTKKQAETRPAGFFDSNA